MPENCCKVTALWVHSPEGGVESGVVCGARVLLREKSIEMNLVPTRHPGLRGLDRNCLKWYEAEIPVVSHHLTLSRAYSRPQNLPVVIQVGGRIAYGDVLYEIFYLQLLRLTVTLGSRLRVVGVRRGA